LSLKNNKLEFNFDYLVTINQLKQLIGLDLSHNYLRDFDSISKLNQIEVLDITYNPNFHYQAISLTNSLELVKIGPVSQNVSDSLTQKFHIKEFNSLLEIYPFLEPYSIIEKRKALYKRFNGAILSLSKK
jgi:hypothetical protein